MIRIISQRVVILTALIILTVIFSFGTDIRPALAQEDCASTLQACLKDSGDKAKGIGESIRNSIRNCKAVRKCRQTCRAEKFDCRGDCRKKHGVGKDFRECVRGCRSDKRDCRDECQDSFLTSECTEARRSIGSSALKTLPSCFNAGLCLKNAK